MKNKLKIVAMALCFLSISSQAFATGKSNINEYGTDVKEETIVSSDTPQYQDTQEQNKKIVPFDPSKKNDIHESRGRIIMNVDQKGNDFNSRGNKFDLIPFTTANGTTLKLLVNYDEYSEDVVLLGTTDEQELASMTKNLTEETREREKEREEFQEESRKLREENREKLQEEKRLEKEKKKQIQRMLMLPIILGGVAVALVLKYLKKKKEANEEGLEDEGDVLAEDMEDEFEEAEDEFDDDDEE